MKKIITKIYMGIAILSMLFITACGNQQAEESVAMGRYIEQGVAFEEMRGAIWLNQTKDKAVQIFSYTEQGLKLYEKQEDNSFLEIQKEGIQQFNKNYSDFWLRSVTTDAAGMIYVGCVMDGIDGSDPTNVENKRTHIFKLSEEEIVEDIILNVPDELNYIMPREMRILANGKLLVEDRFVVEQYSLETGNFIRRYAKLDVAHILVTEDELYVVNVLDNQIDTYDLEGGQIKKSIPCSSKLDENTILVEGEDQDIYLVTREGIQHLVNGGEIWEQIASGSGLSLSLPSRNIEQVIYNDGKFMVRFLTDQYENILCEYVYSATTPTKPTEEINVYSLMENQMLRETVNRYEIANPQTKVNLQYGISETANISRSDAIKALNAEILGGEGPDILILDGLDAETYYKEGVLLDLGELASSEELMQPMVNCFKVGDYTYAIPLRFSIPTLWGSEEVLNQINGLEDLANYQEKYQDETVLASVSAESVFKQWASVEQVKWFNEKNELQEEALVAFLENIRCLASKRQEGEAEKSGPILRVCSNDAQIYGIEENGVMSTLVDACVIKTRGEGTFKILESEGKKVYYPLSIVGINKNSHKQELSKQLIAYMLEEDSQVLDLESGFPIHKNALNTWMKGETSNQEVSTSYRNEEVTLYIGWYEEWFDEGVFKAYYEEMQGLEQSIMGNEQPIEIILDNTTDFFEGNMTAEETVAMLKPKLELYIQE